jgi:hypothetical protein
MKMRPARVAAWVFMSAVTLMLSALLAKPQSAPKAPELAEAKKVAILKLQKQILQDNFEIAQLQAQYNGITQDAQKANKELTDLVNEAMKAGGKEWSFDVNTLSYAAAPAAPAPASTPAPAKAAPTAGGK